MKENGMDRSCREALLMTKFPRNGNVLNFTSIVDR